MSKGDQTRQAILHKAISLSSMIGLEDLTIGKLAQELKMSKSGLFAHFRSKENLQLQIIEELILVFYEHVMKPAFKYPRGIPRIRKFYTYWKKWVDGDIIPGGCVAISSAVEFDDRPGKVRDNLKIMYQSLLDAVARAAQIAIKEKHFRPDADPSQFAYEMHAIILGYHIYFRLISDPMAEDHSDRAFEQLMARYRNGDNLMSKFDCRPNGIG